jgi:hypothetical protein
VRPSAGLLGQLELPGRVGVEADHERIGRRRQRAAQPEQPAKAEALLERAARRRQRKQRAEAADQDADRAGCGQPPHVRRFPRSARGHPSAAAARRQSSGLLRW